MLSGGPQAGGRLWQHSRENERGWGRVDAAPRGWGESELERRKDTNEEQGSKFTIRRAGL